MTHSPVADLISIAKEKAHRGDQNGAMSLAVQLVEQYPTEARVWSLRSFLFALRKEFAKALTDITRAINIHPEPHFFFTRGRYNFELGDDQSAVKDFSTGLHFDHYEDDSYREELYFWRAEAFIRLGNKREALSDLAHLHKDKQTWTYELRSKLDLLVACDKLPD
jgi:tetratricopeptide (TPR) repeat protein